VKAIKYSITNGHNSYMLWKLIGLCRKCEIKTSWNLEILYSQADFMVDTLTIYNSWNEFEKYLCGIAKEFRMFLKCSGDNLLLSFPNINIILINIRNWCFSNFVIIIVNNISFDFVTVAGELQDPFLYCASDHIMLLFSRVIAGSPV
jgi:hypothetical protein